jgi:hypothetical protein
MAAFQTVAEIGDGGLRIGYGDQINAVQAP